MMFTSGLKGVIKNCFGSGEEFNNTWIPWDLRISVRIFN